VFFNLNRAVEVEKHGSFLAIPPSACRSDSSISIGCQRRHFDFIISLVK